MSNTDALRMARDALEGYPYDDGHWRNACQPALVALNAALAKQPAASEPVAPVDHTQLLRMLARRARCFPSFPIGAHMPEVFAAISESPPDWTPPQPAPALVPLTEAQIDDIINASRQAEEGPSDLVRRCFRAAHGITAAPKATPDPEDDDPWLSGDDMMGASG